MIWTDESRTTEQARFHYPRQSAAPYLCIDFFRPIDSGEVDYAAFHIVTMGQRVSDVTAELFAADRYQEYLLVHGLGRRTDFCGINVGAELDYSKNNTKHEIKRKRLCLRLKSLNQTL